MILRVSVVVAAGLVVLGGFACARGEDPADARGTTVIMAVPNVEVVKPDVWDLDFLIFLPLAKLNEHGELEGRLARSWEPSSDHREYIFHLRTDVFWDDGVRVTAHDVKFTLELLGHPDVAEYAGIEATVVDDSTVRIRAAKPGYINDIVYYPRHLLEDLDPKDFWVWPFWTNPAGNGPYRFVQYVPETMMEFEANPDYYGAQPRIERLILKFVGAAGLTELLAGNVDIVGGVDLTQIPRVAGDARFRVYVQAFPGARAIQWKVSHPLFSDRRVRRALTLALDRRELLRFVNLPPELPITDGVFTERLFRRREWPEPLPYDPEQSRALLEAAGWVDREGDGIREKDGRPFRFTATVLNGRSMDRIAVYVQAQLRRVGVQMDIRLLEGAAMWEKLRNGDFEAWVFIDQAPPDGQQRNHGRGNAAGYDNPEAFEVIDRLEATADPEEVDALYRRLTEIYRADPPFTRLIPYTRDWFVHRRIRGLSTPFRAEPDTYMEELWVEES
jgi:peptide/nickel transport system substrate-binding protein